MALYGFGLYLLAGYVTVHHALAVALLVGILPFVLFNRRINRYLRLRNHRAWRKNKKRNEELFTEFIQGYEHPQAE
jgi:thiosulfate reductase cytochrome b subunit